jgi:epoxyqueuosine reductase
MNFSDEIKQQALAIGFDACGICRAQDSEQGTYYRQWLSAGYQAGMDYLERNVDKRIDPRLLVPGAKSIISVALNYFPQKFLPADVPQFAYYAYGRDYHEVVRNKLALLFDFVRQYYPEVNGRFFCDSAPVLERYWAAKAGIGFIGKNTLLIIPGKGSYFFLGELILDLELEYDTPIPQNCGSCRRCIDACPTKAIEQPYVLNAGKCISYQTIENKGDIDAAIQPLLSNNVYGCDICQKVCPWNRFAKPNQTPDFLPSEEFLSLDLAKLQAMDEDSYRHIFCRSAVKRAKFSGLKRNVEAISKTRDNSLLL